MKRLMRHAKTGQWVSAKATLTDDLQAALETETLSQALEFCQKHKLHDVEIVLRFGDPRYDSTIYVSDTVLVSRTPV